MLDADIIIVNYRTERLTADLVAHLRHGEDAPARIVIVDNSPERGLLRLLPAATRGLTYVPMPRNVGFAAGVNEGARHGLAVTLILLNPDAWPDPGCLAGLMTVLARDPSVAAAGPRLLSAAGQAAAPPSATWRPPSFTTALVEYSPLHRLARGWLQRRYFVDPGALTGPVDCAQVQGACLAIRRACWDDHGGFDAQRFFLWEENRLLHARPAARRQDSLRPEPAVPPRGRREQRRQGQGGFILAQRVRLPRQASRARLCAGLALCAGGWPVRRVAARGPGGLRRPDAPHRAYRDQLGAMLRAQLAVRGPSDA